MPTDPSENSTYAKGGEFLKARFAGGRFDHHIIPFDVLTDLSSYRDLVIEVAKLLYKRRYEGRARVPKGFEESFQLGLAAVQGGSSAVAVANRLPSRAAAQIPLLGEGLYPEFEEARQYIEQLIQRVNTSGTVPDDFPEELAGKFNPFGKNLQDDEYVELSFGSAVPVRYDNYIRKKIILSREATYEASVDDYFTLNGGVIDTGTIHVRNTSGEAFDYKPLTQAEFQKALTNAPAKVRLVGNGLFDREDKLRRLMEVSTVHDDVTVPEYIDRLVEISKTEIGWYDGENPVPTAECIGAMRSFISSTALTEMASSVYLYPTPEGELSAEWSLGEMEICAQTLPDNRISFTAINILEAKKDSQVHNLNAASPILFVDFIKKHQITEQNSDNNPL